MAGIGRRTVRNPVFDGRGERKEVSKPQVPIHVVITGGRIDLF
jgi:hypothetical protein